MAYYSEAQLDSLGFKAIGNNVKISDKACIYDCENIEIGEHSRIDDFCIISGNVVIGSYCHITPMCLIAGGLPGVVLSDFCTLAYGVKVFSQSDDYSGETLVNSMVPREYKNEQFEKVVLGKHVVIGANSTILPGVTIAEGCSVGAMSLVNGNTDCWGIYVGTPARRIKERKKDLLILEKAFLEGEKSDSV